MTVTPSVIPASSSGNQLTFTFKALGTMDGGAIRLTIPSGWSPPQAIPGVAGYTTVIVSAAVIGVPTFSGMAITVPIVTLGPNQTIMITYGAGGGSSGAVAQSNAGGALFLTESKGSAGGSFATIANIPVVSVVDGAGTVTLVDQSPALTWNYQLTHSSGSVPQWTYIGDAITGASVDGEAQAAGWSVLLQTATLVMFTTPTPLTSGSLTGFHITGAAGGPGTWTAGTNSGSVEGSLPVELSSFTAEATTNGVMLKWRTQSETNNLGFHLYRSKNRDGDYVRITPTLIKGHGTDATPHDYSFLDETAEAGQSYWYLIEDVDLAGVTERSNPIQVIFQHQDIPYAAPTHFALHQNYPNPFNPETWIPYQLAADATVFITIYNALGQQIRTLTLGHQAAGSYLTKEQAVHWDGRGDTGEWVSSGLYFYQLRAGDFNAVKRMVILK